MLLKETTKLALKFVEDNFDNINLEAVGSITSKEQILKEIKEDYCTACWILTEVMSWGTKDGKDYIDEFIVDNEEDIFVIKLEDKYFKINHETHCLDECEPKYKTIVYF
jgi:hypothetical protein